MGLVSLELKCVSSSDQDTAHLDLEKLTHHLVS